MMSYQNAPFFSILLLICILLMYIPSFFTIQAV